MAKKQGKVEKLITIDPRVWARLHSVKASTGIPLGEIVERALTRVIEMESKDASAFLNRG